MGSQVSRPFEGVEQVHTAIPGEEPSLFLSENPLQYRYRGFLVPYSSCILVCAPGRSGGESGAQAARAMVGVICDAGPEELGDEIHRHLRT